MKVLVCGGRHYTDREKMYKILYELVWCNDDLVIHGNAKGADSLAGEWARAAGIQEISCPANWDTHGKSAGYRRNKAMLSLQPDLVLAFPGGPGTANMIKLAKEAGVKVREIEVTVT